MTSKNVPQGRSNMQSELQTGSLLPDYNHNWSWSTNVSKTAHMSSSAQQNLMGLTGAPSCSNHLMLDMTSVSDTSIGLNYTVRLSALDYIEPPHHLM
jgi:hypothetical protein